MSDNFQQANANEKKVLPPLDKDQVEYAHEQLEELHPLEKTPLREAFPWLGAATCYKKGQVDDNYVEAKQADGKKTVKINGKEIVKKQPKKKKNPIGDEKVAQADPIAKLGFGIVAYVNMLWMLIWTFFIYTLLLMPTFIFFYEGSAYDNVAVKSDYLDTYLGNLGYSSVQCASIPTRVGRLALSCPYGTIGKYLDYGINPDVANKNTCVTDDTNRKCSPTAPFVQANLEGAIGQGDHLFDFAGVGALFASTPDPSCDSAQSTLFVQFTCEQALTDQEAKYNSVALAVATGVAICLLFTVSIRAAYQGGKIQQIEWDVTTVTAGDFSVEFAINEKDYLHWKENVYEAAGGPMETKQQAPAYALKLQMKEEIQKNIDGWVKQNQWALEELYGKSKKTAASAVQKQYGGTKVADIVFSFNNAALIEALRTRGGCIAAQDFDKMREQETKINDLFQDFDDLTIPTAAFVTFESDDSANLALDVHRTPSDHRIMGQEMKFTKPSEPTDIIWENRHFTRKEYIMRELTAYAIIGVLLFGSLIVIYVISAYSMNLAAVFPPTDCNGLQLAYGDELQTYAVFDYDYVVDPANANQPSSGCLQCFCIQQAKEYDVDYAIAQDYGQADGDKICEYYTGKVMTVYLWTSALSYLLIGINYILRTVCIMLVDWIGYATETERLSKTTTVTFIVQYFNSAFLLLMVNANMSEQPITFWLTTGSLPDFNSGWFRSVGDIIVGAMVFNIYYPIIEVLGYWGLRILFRCLDRSCSCKKEKVGEDGTMVPNTKSTSIQGYISIYQGPQYFMHFKYSSILTIAYITFMYGFGMPVLFPIAMLSFLVLYAVEKFMLFYGHITPPMYDERLSNDVLTKLQFAPLLYLIFGYWMASSQQLLSNDSLYPMAQSTDTYTTGHTMTTVFQGEGWDGIKWPMMIGFIILNIIWYAGDCVQNWLYECFPVLRIGDIEINEDIDNYWATLDEEDRKWSTKEEENARDALKMHILTDEQFDRLKTEPMTKGKTLQGVHSYDILANPLYLDDFQYVTAAEDDRADMIIDDDDDEGNDNAQSDLVRLSLNLAFMLESKARVFKFNKDGLKEALDNLKPGHSLN